MRTGSRHDPDSARRHEEHAISRCVEQEQLLDTLLPFHVAVQVNRALLESSAAEHAARMTALDSATRNAKEMVERLTLYMNKVRQASITREIIEIVAGAQSV